MSLYGDLWPRTEKIFLYLILHEARPNSLTWRECVTKFFTSIFSWFEPIWAPNKQALEFLNSFRFCKNVWIFKKLCGVRYPTTEVQDVHLTAETISTVGITSLSKTMGCVCIIPRVKCSKFLKKLHIVHHTAESISMVCIAPQSQQHSITKKLLVPTTPPS